MTEQKPPDLKWCGDTTVHDPHVFDKPVTWNGLAGAQFSCPGNNLIIKQSKRILVTGSREWTDGTIIHDAIRDTVLREPDAVVIHGGAWGADRLAGAAARALGLDEEIYPARNFTSPRARNQHMVNLGADVCLSFARSWASGTGMCARMARKARIPVVDFGVRTK